MLKLITESASCLCLLLCRYNTSSNVFKAPNDGVTASSSIVDNNVEVAKRESVSNIQTQSNEHLLYQISNRVSNNIDIGSSTTKLSAHPQVVKDKFEAASSIIGLHPSSAFRSVKNDRRCADQQVSLVMTHGMQPTLDLAPVRGLHQEFQMQHTHHYHQHHHHHHFHILEHPSSNHDEFSLKKLTTDASHSGTSKDGNTRTYSLNKCALRCNHESAAQIGSRIAVNAVGTIAKSDVGEAGKSGSGDASGIGSGNTTMVNKLAHRETAVTKFRLKRKGRSLKKKVDNSYPMGHYFCCTSIVLVWGSFIFSSFDFSFIWFFEKKVLLLIMIQEMKEYLLKGTKYSAQVN